MGFMDKVKAQAEQAVAKAQQGVAQGQARLDTMQASRQADALLRDLGAAYYAEQRQGAPSDAVAAALAKVDAHATEHGTINTAATAPSPGSPAAPTPPTGAAGPAAAGSAGSPTAPPASYSLDDL